MYDYRSRRGDRYRLRLCRLAMVRPMMKAPTIGRRNLTLSSNLHDLLVILFEFSKS